MIYRPQNIDDFKKKAQYWASYFSTACMLDSNGYTDAYSTFSWAIAVGEKKRFTSGNTRTFEDLQDFIDAHSSAFIPGFFSYDLKNEIESLHTPHPNRQGFDQAFFFVAETLILYKGGDTVEIKAIDPEQIITAIQLCEPNQDSFVFSGAIQARTSETEYDAIFNSLKKHILQGDIYEINLCQEFFAGNAVLDPFSAYRHLRDLSPCPFACFLKYDDKYIISASPERFLKKTGNTLVSQPIKGTAKRWADPDQDRASLEALISSPKEVSENIMIVDLVRHDLTKSALPGSVIVKELLGTYSFKQVHQLISTIECALKPSSSSTHAIKNAFPPGSMTGAPKVRAMEIIDDQETTRRGVYSGAMGYFYRDDFDLSVVIRSLLYNKTNGYLSFHVGGAITASSNALDEYRECLLKASAIQTLLGCTYDSA